MLDADEDLVPIVGADNAGFVQQLLEVEGLVGAAVTNSAAVGGAGVTLALQILNGEEPAEKVTLTEPQIWANDTEEGLAQLEEANDPDIDPTGRCSTPSRGGPTTRRTRSSPARGRNLGSRPGRT